MGDRRIIEFLGFKLCLNENVYEPAEDSELLASILDLTEKEKVVDVGSGTGILSLVLSKRDIRVLAIDINPFASEETLCSAKINDVDIDVINCDGLSCVRDGIVFDAIVFNPPYLPVQETKEWIGFSWSGGEGGLKALEKILNDFKAKRGYFVYSSFTDEEKLNKLLESKSLKLVKRKEIVKGFEVLKAVEVVVEGCPCGA
ncbi:methyltransferase [Metallosphaera tengchongensis]|uniref:Methyltransferase n=1 Tax=Metallosphaera tengchongensis TaxID=1532350 RepID=A0A6N0NX09_9CREN|nr:HemK2/MTQ2 family protein methyltransferase [Metallosphaera tengchongensis]QKQ99897.1 methyltransferase [Metallosphaera tengchongensis]